ncbi:hypothetical protein [Promicromonospora sukumoe]|uniref:hypothetical protein n=1 Tax=Promicromonospora sukumoe TaxID=88382 RepID=UPI0036604F2D
MVFDAVSARPMFGRGLNVWSASLAATTLLAAGMVPAIPAVAGPAPGGTGPGATVTALAAQPVPSTVLIPANELPTAAQVVALAGSVVFVQVAGESGPQVLWREQDGGEWSSVWGGTELAGELIAAEGDVVQLRQGEDEILTWTRDGGGSRTVPDGTTLGRGARYVGYLDSKGFTALQAVTAAGDLPMPIQKAGRGEDGIVIVGDRVVSLSGTFAHVYDIPTARGVVSEYVCPDADRYDTSLAGAGTRMIFASCGASGGIGVADHGDVYARLTPAGSLDRGFVAGETFALGLSTATGDLTVVPALSAPGDGTNGTLGAATSFDLGDDATTVGFIDAVGDVRRADLSGWSSEPATEIIDTTPPSATYPEIDGEWANFVLIERSYRVSTEGGDAGTYPFRSSGLVGGELRYRQKLAGQSSFGAFVIAGSLSASATHPAGSSNCWSSRLVDGAGNWSGWGPEECVTIDGTRPVVSTTALPARVRATSTSTPVTFKYAATDNGKVAGYDVRYRKDKGGTKIGSWVYPASGTGVTARSFTVGTAKSYRVCFSVRARDTVGNTTSWSPSRCTFVDGVAPRVTKAELPERWLPTISDGLLKWNPRFTYAASDDQRVASYQVQTRTAGMFGRLSARPTTYGWSTSRSTTSGGLNPGDQTCLRVRAKDTVGNVSGWSAWRCVNAPFMNGRGHINGANHGIFAFSVHPNEPASTARNVAVRAVRVKVQAGPGYGAMKVYAGSEYLGTVSAYSKSSGTKWATLTTRSGTVKSTKVRFVATSSRAVKVKAVYFAR